MEDVNECVDPSSERDDDGVETTTTVTLDVTLVDDLFESLLPEALENAISQAASNWSFPCGAAATCINTPGSYECRCPAGFSGKPREKCTDVNECGLASTCGENAKCMNVPGSYKCYCPRGFEGDGDVACSS